MSGAVHFAIRLLSLAAVPPIKHPRALECYNEISEFESVLQTPIEREHRGAGSQWGNTGGKRDVRAGGPLVNDWRRRAPRPSAYATGVVLSAQAAPYRAPAIYSRCFPFNKKREKRRRFHGARRLSR